MKITDKKEHTESSTSDGVTRSRQKLTGVVVKKSGEKTVAVEVSRVYKHPLYGKRRQTATRFLVHDPENQAEVGQTVLIREYRPVSKRKRWILAGNDEATT